MAAGPEPPIAPAVPADKRTGIGTHPQSFAYREAVRAKLCGILPGGVVDAGGVQGVFETSPHELTIVLTTVII